MYDFVAHPANIPVEASLLPESLEPCPDSSFWGLRIPSSHPARIYSQISVRFALDHRRIEAVGQVVNCAHTAEGYEVWVRFSSMVECQKARMGEQACQMEYWRREQEELGRTLGMDQAYREWLDLYAGTFPKIEEAAA